MATDIIVHRFWVDLDSILGCFFGVKVGKKGYQKTQQKHACKKVTRRIPGNPGKPREIRAWILWSLKTIQRPPKSQDWSLPWKTGLKILDGF